MTELLFDPKNARKHPERNKGMIRESLQEVGGFRSIAVDGENIIRAGNGVYEQAQALGMTVRIVDAAPNELIAVRRQDLKGKKAVRAALLDNRAGETSDWDAAVLADIAQNEKELLAGLFDDSELAEILAQDGTGVEETADAGELLDKAAELQKKWNVQRGDVWSIGRHKLMCGDSTSAEDVGTLMGEDRWDLVVTSPPYNSGDGGYKTDYHGKTKKFYVGKTDDRTEPEYILFCDQILDVCSRFRRDDSSVVVWNCVPTARARGAYGRVLFAGAHPFTVKESIVWDKGHGFPSASKGILSRQVEFIFVLSVGETYNTTQGENEPRWNVWKIDRPLKQDEIHRATFPIELPLRAIHDLSVNGAILFEPFSGVGTVIVAAEQTGRTARAMEIEPAYCSAMLERMSLLGLTPQRID